VLLVFAVLAACAPPGMLPDGGFAAGGGSGGSGGSFNVGGGSQLPWLDGSYFKATNTAPQAHFGQAVALSGDGLVMAVGAPAENGGGVGVNPPQNIMTAEWSGAVYLYRKVAGTWTPEAYLKASDSAQGAQFGFAVALSADGSTLAVGAPTAETALPFDFTTNGQIYVFRHSASGWVQSDLLQCPLALPPTDDLYSSRIADGCGAALSMSASGDVLAAAWADEYVPDSVHVSAPAHLFVFEHSAQAWSATSITPNRNTMGDEGHSPVLALSGDGLTLAAGWGSDPSASIGVNGDRTNGQAPYAGAVHVYRKGTGDWAEEAYLKASNTDASDGFGVSVAVSADGSMLVAGAPGESSASTGINGDGSDNASPGSGAAYVFRRNGTSWQQVAYVKALNANVGTSNGFGAQVALSGTGERLLITSIDEWLSGSLGIAAPPTRAGWGNFVGAVYSLHCTPDCAFDTFITPAKAGPTDEEGFGSSLSVSTDGRELAVGDPVDDSGAVKVGGDTYNMSSTHAGAVWMFVSP
jgi:hypothetical protein